MKTILITGGTGKLGKVLVNHFLKKNYHVVFTSLSNEKIGLLINEHIQYSDCITGIAVDLCEFSGVDYLIEELQLKNLDVNFLINNARSLASLKVESNNMTSRKNFMDEYLLDVIIPYEITLKLADNKNSVLQGVVNVGSQYGSVATNPGLYTNHEQEAPIQYSVAKAALSHLTKELAIRLSDKGVRVNCVAFGGIEGRVNSEFKKRYARLNPMKRMLTEKEVPGPIDFLISDSSSSMTGQTINADGGWTIW